MSEALQAKTGIIEVQLDQQLSKIQHDSAHAQETQKQQSEMNFDARRRLQGTEGEGREQRTTYMRIQDRCAELNGQLDLEEGARNQLLRSIQDLEQQKVMLLGNNNRYDEDEIKLARSIREMQDRIERLKTQSMALTQEMDLAAEADRAIRKQLHIKNSVRKIKEENLTYLSAAKSQVMERNIHERYDIGGLERVRRPPEAIFGPPETMVMHRQPERLIGEERPTAAATYVDEASRQFPGAPGAGYLRRQSPLRTKLRERSTESPGARQPTRVSPLRSRPLPPN